MISIVHTLLSRAFLVALFAMIVTYAVGRIYGQIRGWADCLARAEPWARRRQAVQARSAVLPLAQVDATRRRLRIRLVRQPRGTTSQLLRVRAAGRGVRLGRRNVGAS